MSTIDDAILMAENKEEQKTFLIRVKESENNDLKLNIKKKEKLRS